MTRAVTPRRRSLKIVKNPDSGNQPGQFIFRGLEIVLHERAVVDE